MTNFPNVLAQGYVDVTYPPLVNSVSGANCGAYTYDILNINTGGTPQPFPTTVGISLETSTVSNTRIPIRFNTGMYTPDFETSLF